MDFIERLPRSNGKDMIWVVVDRLSKYAHFVPLTHLISAAVLARVFMDQITSCMGHQPILSVTEILCLSVTSDVNFWDSWA